jgi:hypothetical protein
MELVEDCVKVFCSSITGDLSDFLSFRASHLAIWDPVRNRIELSSLADLCREYWDAFGLHRDT